MTTEHLILVDKNDNEIGYSEKIAAHRDALLHRAFSVFIIRGQADNPEILLQKRNPSKYHCGGLWTNTCCGHPRPGEQTKTAAERRLFEEMGIRTQLTYIDKFQYIAHFDNGLTESEIDHVFYQYDNGQDFVVNPEEVVEIRWLSLHTLKQQINSHPEKFTPWLKQALEMLMQ